MIESSSAGSGFDPRWTSARRALELWWIGSGGQLRSVGRCHYSGGSSNPEGVDYPQLVALKMAPFFFGRAGGWKDLAGRLVELQFQAELLPDWVVAPSRVVALGESDLVNWATCRRGPALMARLLFDVDEWLAEHPLPAEPSW